MKEYTEEYLKEKKIREYISTFKNTPDKIIHELELFVIKRIIKKYALSGKYLDVACGFGRIANFSSKFFKKSFAIDASQGMIRLMRKNCRGIKSLCMDAENIEFEENTFDLATTFRFVMNFDKKTRLDMLREINKVLKNKGIFLCNIHLNKWSARGVSSQIRNKYKKTKQPCMSYFEAKRELNASGFRILEFKGIKILPFYKNMVFLSPDKLIRIEKILASTPLLKFFADGYIFVCEKRSSS